MTTVTVAGVTDRLVAIPRGMEMLAPFVGAGVFGAYEVQFAASVFRLQPGLGGEEVLALALAARAPRFGHVYTRLDDVEVRLEELDSDVSSGLPWPSGEAWAAAVGRSPLVAGPDTVGQGTARPLVWDGDRLYLQRYWHYELAIADDLVQRCSPSLPDGIARPGPDGASTDAALDALFGPGDGSPDLQRLAARRGLAPGVSIIAGGPGTGKTYTVARLLAAAHMVAGADGRDLKVALAAPTGKAAARMGEAVRDAALGLGLDRLTGSSVVDKLVATDPTTMHALLGWDDRTHFRHSRKNPLPHDLVIIDETSMVSLPLMAKLLDAVRPRSSVVLVGDPFQLASIEAGTVMSDLVGPAGDPRTLGDPGQPDARGEPNVPGKPDAGGTLDVPGERDHHEEPGATGSADGSAGPVLAGRVTVLRAMRRFEGDSGIAALAEAVRTGDGDRALSLLGEGRVDLRWIAPDDPAGVEALAGEIAAVGVEQVRAAQRGDASAAMESAGRMKVLAGTRRGPLGVYDWTARLERDVADRVGGFHPDRRWHVGRPVMVTQNDRANRVFNGDTGVVVRRDDGMAVALSSVEGPSVGGDRLLAPSRLDRVETWWAMTIHKSQGSEFPHAVVSLPDSRSQILTRELLYTAVTRARDTLTVVGSAEALERAVSRPVARASGLRDRLWPG